MRTLIRFSVLTLLLFAFFKPVYSQWTKVDVGNIYPIAFVKYFSDQQVLMASGDGLITTSNGGVTWQKKEIVDTLGNAMIAAIGHIYYFNDKEAIACGIIHAGSVEVLLRTKNGGQSWYIVNVFQEGKWPLMINQTDFAGSVGYAVGSNGRILKSTDKGVHWSPLASGKPTTEFKSLKVLDANTLVVVGQETIMRSADGGSSWTTYSLPGHVFTSVDFKNALTGMAVGDMGEVYSTINAGVTWTPLKLSLTYSYRKLKYYAGGVFLLGNGFALHSANDGKTWENHIIDPFRTFYDVDFYGTKAYLTGDNGIVYKNDNLAASARPIANFSSNKALYCKDSTVTFTNQGSDANTYQWYVNNQPAATTKNFSYKLTTASQSYTVKLIASNAMYKDTAQMTFSVESDLGINLVASIDNSQLCPGYTTSIRVKNTQINVQYQLLNGSSPMGTAVSGNGADLVLPTDLVHSPVTYTVSASTTNTCGTNTVKKSFPLTVETSLPELKWQELSLQGISAKSSRISTIDFLNDKVGFAISSYNSHFLKTTDGGVNWTVTSPFSWNQFGNEVDFVTENIGYVANQTFYKTIDGGKTFFRSGNPGDGWVDRVHFQDISTGLVTSSGTDAGSPRIIYKTTDGGVTFKEVYKTYAYGLSFSNIDCPNKNVCYISGFFSYLYAPDSVNWLFKSTDGGDTWKQMMIPSGNGFSSIDFVDELTGYAVGNGKAFKTVDGGLHWTSSTVIGTDTWPSFSVIKMQSKEVGYAAGYNRSSNGDPIKNFVYKTENGGNCWQRVTDVLEYQIEDMEIPSANTLYLSGAQSTFGQGFVLKNKTGDWVKFNVEDTLVCSGKTLRVESTSSGYTNLQWYVDNKPQVKTASASLTVTGIGEHAIKLVGTKNGVSDSAKTHVRVSDAPYIYYSSHPSDKTGCAGNSLNFFGNADSDGRLIYQWQLGKNDQFKDLSEGYFAYGVNKTDLRLSDVSDTLNGWQVRLKSTAKCAEPAYSNAGTITIINKPVVSLAPVATSACPYQTARFSVEASNAVTSYQWIVYGTMTSPGSTLNNYSPYAGTYTKELTISPVENHLNNSRYACVLTNSCGSTTSQAGMLTVPQQVPRANAGSDQTICAGQTARLGGGISFGTQGVWTSSGTGTFVNGTSMAPSYTPSVQDIRQGKVTLTFTPTDMSSCPTIPDQMVLTVGVCTGLEEAAPALSNVTVFPNPATGNSVSIRSAVSAVKQVQLYTTEGQFIQNWAFDQNVRSSELSLNKLPEGIYLLQIQLQNGDVSRQKLSVSNIE